MTSRPEDFERLRKHARLTRELVALGNKVTAGAGLVQVRLRRNID